ncbi:MAG: DUF421 domain-containing protein [Planctomycetaceae bacterium]|nr:DUF421 domain-containing protein [Planctomycetaceae bacterium]
MDNSMDYLPVIGKILVGSVTLVVYARLGGRSQVNPMAGTEVVSGMVVGAMISGSLFNNDVPVWAVGAVILLWTLLFSIMSKYKRKSLSGEKLVDGQSVCLVSDGRLQPQSFDSLNLTLTDFETMIHQAGVHALSELREVWQETNGKLTISKYDDPKLSVLLVERGRVHKDGLSRIGKDQEWLKTQIESKGVTLSEVFCGEYHNGTVRIDTRDGRTI